MQWERDYMSYRKKEQSNKRSSRKKAMRDARSNSFLAPGSPMMAKPGMMESMCGCLKRNKNGAALADQDGGLPTSPTRLNSFFKHQGSTEMADLRAAGETASKHEFKEDDFGYDTAEEQFVVNEQNNIVFKNKKKPSSL